ncbi:hypothetical protein [Schlesneria sp.]|uniref:hypothetical protein n=1 Tax=Schlesneria sp. TaxID=2762018 RepID=UPI002F191116
MNFRNTIGIIFAFAFPNLVMPVQAQVVPGTGQQIIEVFDDFEDPEWAFNLNLPKASANLDKTERHPSGFSNNRLFLESLYRGTPDFVSRVEAPAGGVPGSKGALGMQTLNSGIPGQRSYTFQQDDLIAGVQHKLGYMIPASWTPSYVTHVYIPPFDKWERRHGSHFGFRADCTTTITKQKNVGRLFKSFGSTRKLEQYWPGFFIQLNLKEKSGQSEDFAMLLIRSDQNGNDVPGPKITRPGWWTLGMTITPDGRVHYYAHEGVERLTARDHLYSNFPYGYRCEQTSTFFFNIVNQDDGRTWSTRWIVDDPKVYVASGTYRAPAPQQVVSKPQTTASTQTSDSAGKLASSEGSAQNGNVLITPVSGSPEAGKASPIIAAAKVPVPAEALKSDVPVKAKSAPVSPPESTSNLPSAPPFSPTEEEHQTVRPDLLPEELEDLAATEPREESQKD